MSSMADSTENSTDMAAEDLSGRTLGDYRVLRRLGHGAMAEVYLAEQSSLRRQVALKVLTEDRANDEIYVQRFHREARAAAALVHANIVQIYEVGQIDGIHYIAQEYVQGMNLRQLLTRFGPPETPLAVAIIRQVAAALHKAGEQGIVHRDIKPENIMITSDRTVKVADFGLARIIGDGESVDLTQAGMTMGTPLYMSPEQVEGLPLDPRSDIYSLGVTCYHLLAGQPPFRGDTPLSVAVAHIKNQPERLENQRQDLPEGLCRIVHKMLAKRPEERFSSASELLRELRSLQTAGDDEAWAEDLEEWTSAQLTAMHSARHSATDRLGQLMKTSATPVVRKSNWWLAAALAVALGGGSVAGWMTREPWLLSGAGETLDVAKKQTAEMQYRFAMFHEAGDREAGWLAVVRYFPESKKENTYWVRLAKQQLARLYLQLDDRQQDAWALFNEFAAKDDTDPQGQAFGIAGQCVLHLFAEEHAAAADKLIELGERRKYLDHEMRGMIERYVFPLIRESISEQEQQKWNDWLEEKFSEQNEN